MPNLESQGPVLPVITNVFATRRKNFSQWHRSFQRKLLSHWLKFGIAKFDEIVKIGGCTRLNGQQATRGSTHFTNDITHIQIFAPVMTCAKICCDQLGSVLEWQLSEISIKFELRVKYH